MKIAIIGCKGVPASYGGFETLAENLVRHLRKQCEFIVYCSAPGYDDRPAEYLGAELKYLPLDANGVQSIPYDVWSMIDASRKADVLLILGVSGCMFLPLIKPFCRGKILVNLDGMDWKRPKWSRLARAFLKWSETVAARFADGLVADNEAIKDYIFEFYGKDSFLVEYGGDHANTEVPVKQSDNISITALSRHNQQDDLVETGFKNYAIAVCRIEPENHIHLILEAFAKAGSQPLVFLGNWDYSEYGQDLRRRYADKPNILLLDPIFTPHVLFALRSNAGLYVHGHSSGGTNPSLVESMSLGLPVIAFDVIFNRTTTENMALYFDSAETLHSKLLKLDELDLAGNAKRMREIANRRYSWKRISQKYESLFASLDLPDSTKRRKATKNGADTKMSDMEKPNLESTGHQHHLSAAAADGEPKRTSQST